MVTKTYTPSNLCDSSDSIYRYDSCDSDDSSDSSDSSYTSDSCDSSDKKNFFLINLVYKKKSKKNSKT